MKKIGICGHFGGNKTYLDGQTVKTKTITNCLEEIYSNQDMNIIDTYYAKKNIIKFIVELKKLHQKSKNIIIFPAQKSLIVCTLLLTFFNIFTYRPIHYVVIGGWLSDYLKNKTLLRSCIKKFYAIYVETETMKNKLNIMELNNVVIMPNAKKLCVLERDKIQFTKCKPFKLCTFSRVRKEKGIEEAIKVVERVNKKYNDIIFTLDIYGQINNEYFDEFKQILEQSPNYIQYKGLVTYDQSVDTLKGYYALLFPTYYSGEGFAGTIIDAFSSGVPVIASDWKYNQEIVKNKFTGLIYKSRNNEMFYECLEWILCHCDEWNSFKDNCLLEAEKYNIDKVIKILTDKLI